MLALSFCMFCCHVCSFYFLSFVLEAKCKLPCNLTHLKHVKPLLYPSLLCPGEEKLNILEIVKPVETVEVVIDPDAAGEDGTLMEEGQLIAVERSALTDDTSEQVTRWAAALEGYRKEQVRLGIPYGKEPSERCVYTLRHIR